jgi:xanthine dehydrogenase YagR molybdenum-binding subunit
MSIKDAAQAVMKKAVQIAPDAWMPGGAPDPLIRQKDRLIGTPVSRLDGPHKVSGTARFAAEFPMKSMVYAALKYSTVARGGSGSLKLQRRKRHLEFCW